MSSTETVEFTAVQRILETPLIASSWSLVNEILSQNAYTKQPFETVLNLTASATDLATTYSAPIVGKLAPIITQADGLANKTLDYAEEKFPSVFDTTAEEILDFAKNTLEENKTRAIGYAELIDSQFAPVVNIIDSNIPIAHDPIQAEHQYERVLVLLKLVNDTLVTKSAESFKHLQETNKLVANLSAAVELISTVAHDQYGRVHTISEAWLADFATQVQRLKELSVSIAAQAKEKAESIPGSKAVLELFEGVAEDLSPVVIQLRTIATDPTPLPDKMNLFRAELTDSVIPALDSVKNRFAGLVTGLLSK